MASVLREAKLNRGATSSSPLLGVSGSPAMRTPSKQGSGPKSEASERRGSLKKRKRIPVVLERWLHQQGSRDDSLSLGEERAAPGTCPGRDKEEQHGE